jgi:nitrite reductase/ring-hydroxylating ferredoxin subunit
MADKERLISLGEHLAGASERMAEVSEDRSEATVARSARLICASGELVEGGDGVRFEIESNREAAPAFAIRHGGRVYGYLNRCAHIAMELDWKPGKFFDADREYLICSTHGALYAPESGACRGGPCRGAALVRLPVFEADGKVYLRRG